MPSSKTREFQLGHVFSDMEITPLEGKRVRIPGTFQLGHVFSDMEIMKPDSNKNQKLIKQVSIGPRLFRHGNTRMGADNGRVYALEFQLGHVFSDMEIGGRK